MKSVLLTMTVSVLVNSLFASQSMAEPKRSPGVRSKAKIVTGPALESATHDVAFIRWTANTGGGTFKHYGIVRYGSDPKHLDRTARSPTKWNEQTLPYVTYRVRIDGLVPMTTYYYTVDAAQADGTAMGLKSPVKKFRVRP